MTPAVVFSVIYSLVFLAFFSLLVRPRMNAYFARLENILEETKIMKQSLLTTISRLEEQQQQKDGNSGLSSNIG